MDLALTCDGLPGPQVATCRSCDDDTGVLPLTCNLIFPSSKAGEPAEKVAPSNREKLVALSLVILLIILVFMLLKELRMSPRIPRSIWKGRGRHVGNPEVKDSKNKMRLDKDQWEGMRGRLPESGGCCGEKVREMAVEEDRRTSPTFLLEHSMIKERKGKKKADKQGRS